MLRRPASLYTNHYDQEKFNLTWVIAIVVVILFGGLSIFHLATQDPNLIPSTVGFGLALIVLGSLVITRKYRFAAFAVLIVGTAISQYDLFAIVNSQKIVDLLWIFTITLYIFLTLGTRWGILTLMVNMTGLILSVAVIPKEAIIEAIINRNPMGKLDIIINLTVGAFVISYLIHQIVKASKTAELNFTRANDKLQEQYDIVRSQNEEKTVMLKEIHHRVKNNLQVITSLLRLQSYEIDDEKSVAHFQEAMNRVVAMALIHDKMYQAEDLSRIDLKAYLETLSADLIQSYSIAIPVKMTIYSEVKYILPKSLVSTALLFNELISNSLKHGFNGLTEGTIDIDIRLPKPDQIRFRYADNGNWKSPSRSNSFGLELIETLTEQLDGTMERIVDQGTVYQFTFQYENPLSES